MQRDARLAVLSREHHHALVMALRIQRELPGSSDAEARKLYTDLLQFWAAAIQPHHLVEADAFLERIAHRGDAGLQRAGRLQRDHRELDGLVDAARAAMTADERRAALSSFGQVLREHVRWEEQDLFEWVQETLPAEDLDAIGAYLATNLPPDPVACPMPHDP